MVINKKDNKKSKKQKILSFINRGIIITVGCLAALITFCNVYTSQVARKYIYENVEKIPCNKYGLLLGTSKTVRGRENIYFTDRINAAALLYHKGKIKYIIASGALSPPYNGPRDMKEALIARRVPASRIIKDGYGYRTLDSIYRAADVFQLKRFTVISQHSHIARAIYIARESRGLDVIGFAADNGRIPYLTFRDRVREYLAKVKMMLDLYILNTRARFPRKKLPAD
jgi:SanA protein